MEQEEDAEGPFRFFDLCISFSILLFFNPKERERKDCHIPPINPGLVNVYRSKGDKKRLRDSARISRGLRAAVLTRASLSRRVRGKPSSESSIIASVVITHAPAPRGAFSAPSDLRLCFLQTTTLLRPRHFRVDTIFFFFFFSAKSYYHKRRPRGKPPKKSSFLAQHPLQLLLGISPLIPCGSF